MTWENTKNMPLVKNETVYLIEMILFGKIAKFHFKYI